MDGDEGEVANLFAVPDFWRSSKWLEQLPPDDATPFFPIPSTDPAEHLKSSLIDLGVANPEYGFFKPPTLQAAPDEETQEEDSAHGFEASDDYESEAETGDDVWMGLGETDDQKSGLRTWDSFIEGTAPNHQPSFITEAGPAAYDILLSVNSEIIGKRKEGPPVVETGAYFSSLLALALGQESVLFLKSDDRLSFRPALPGMRISGYSVDVLQGLEEQCLLCGTQFLELRGFVDMTYSKNRSRCGVALASALDEVIQAVRQDAVLRGQSPRSLLQLQATVKGISAVLTPFHGLVSKLQHESSDEAIMSAVFEHASSFDNSGEWLREIMQEVLRRVSRPWAEFLEEWIGTKREEGIPLTKENVGESKAFIKVDSEVYVDDFGEEVEDVDFRLEKSNMPYFMPEDVARTAFETGRNLRFLRSTHPDHPMSRPDFLIATRPPNVDWLFRWDSIMHLVSEVNAYRDRLVDSIDNYRSAPTPLPGHSEIGLRPAADQPLGFFSMDEKSMEERILASMDKINAPIPQKDEGILASIVRRRLSGENHIGETRLDSRPHWSLLPVLSFGSIVSAQAQIVNRETLRQLFRSHDLRAHLRLQRDFQLFGNGGFSSRLSNALFDPDLERADRQAGIARQGGVMGLRLGERDSWPPASSELRLALMGVLTDSYNGARNQSSNASVLDSSDLPGHLSFAVRNMSETEMEACMNADSLEALDFLRLSYKAPEELSFVLTPIILMQYDRIFKLLLRVLRLVYVVDQLWKDVTRKGQEDDEVAYRFSREARHLVTSVASYFLDVGIALPWKAFEGKLDAVEGSLDTGSAEKLESPEQLREFHSSVLQTMTVALFLRKRQQPVLHLLEEVFSLILSFSKLVRLRSLGNDGGSSEPPAQLYDRFKKKVQAFLAVCRGLTEKSSSAGKGFGGGELRIGGIGDESVVAQLLLKLDGNRYYARH